jgi:hypothetical protein
MIYGFGEIQGDFFQIKSNMNPSRNSASGPASGTGYLNKLSMFCLVPTK